MHNKNKIIFLSKTSKYTYDNKVDIVLSPELYWVRVFDISINNKRDILKIVETLFEDFLDTDNYKFYTIKLENNKHLCFAYMESLLSQAIINANLSLSQISNIYFAQNEFDSFTSFKVNDNYLVYQDNILLKVPKELVNTIDVLSIDLDTINLSKYQISINKSTKYIDNNSLYILSSIFLIIAFINFGKINIITNSTNNILKNQQTIKEQYKLLPTMIQTKSVIETLEKKQKEQIKIRDMIQGKINLKNKKINKVSLNNGNITCE